MIRKFVLGCLAPDLFAGMGLVASPSIGTTVSEINTPQSSIETMSTNCKKLSGDKVRDFSSQLVSMPRTVFIYDIFALRAPILNEAF